MYSALRNRGRFQIQPSSLPIHICSPTSPLNHRHHGALTARWNALSLHRPSCRAFSQSSIIRTHNAAATGLINEKLPGQNSHPDNGSHGRFREFNLAGKVYVLTGGAQGLGLSLAEALVEAGSTGPSLTLLPPSCHELTQ